MSFLNKKKPTEQERLDATLLMLCTFPSWNSLEKAKDVLKEGANPNAQNADGIPALRIAVRSDNEAVASLLIENGADINQTDEHGNTLLHLAIGSFNLRMVNMLIESGADPNIANKGGLTPLQCLKKHVVFKLVDALEAERPQRFAPRKRKPNFNV